MLTSKQRAQLKALAADADTILIIGKGGITENVIVQTDTALRARELVKGRVLESALLTPREVGEQLCEECHAELVHVIGSKFVLFRRNLDEPKIALVRNNPKNAKAKTVKAVKPAQKVKAAKAAARKEQSAKRVYARPAGKRR